MKGYEIVGYWKTQDQAYCFLCGKQLNVPKYTIYPACDYYNCGGFCELEFGPCFFEVATLCEECAKDPVVYVGDMCYELDGPMARDTDCFGEDDYFEDPMDEAYYPAV